MKKIWHHPDRTYERRLEAEFRGLNLPLKKRIDVVWFWLVPVIFSLLILGWLIGVLLGHRLGIFEPPLIRPVEDSRILDNVRDKIHENPLLDAIYHPPEDYIFFSRQDGKIYGYSPSTGLWTTEKPFSKKQLLNPALILLRSGCGADPLSYRSPPGQSWDAGSLWGLTAGGGLVRRSQGQWEILKSDSVLTGSRGRVIKQNQLMTAAVSSNREWLMVGTQADGIGIYQLKTGQWLRFGEEFFQELPSPVVTHITWYRGRFWIGGPAGLVSWQPQTPPPLPRPVPGINGAIQDLDVDFQNRLWVLEKRLCGNNGTGGFDCLRLSRFDLQSSDQPPEIVMDEKNNFPGLVLDDLSFARYWQNRLILAGSAGIYCYDAGLHSWEQYFNGDVAVTLPFSQDKGFYFGFTGGIGVVAESSQNAVTWLLPYPHVNERIVKLHWGRKDEILALSLSGKLFGVNVKEGKVYLLFQGERTGLDAGTFRSAVAFGDMVIFSGDKNALVHHLVTRSYKDVPLGMLPDWLQEPDVQLMAAGDQVYAAVKKKGNTHIYRISAQDAAAANFKKTSQLGVVSGPVSSLRNWGQQGIGVIAAEPDGRVFRFSDQSDVLTGMSQRDMNGAPLLDAAPYRDGLMVATPKGLRNYNYRTRTWETYQHYSGNSSPSEVVQCRDRVWMSTQNGRLLEFKGFNKFVDCIGSEAGFAIPDSQLSDVLVKEGDLYLAGNGRIDGYDPKVRSITERWNLPANGEVKLIDIVTPRRQPLTLVQGMAMVGTQALDPYAGRVLNLFVENNLIWTVRQRNKDGIDYNYLKNYPLNDPLSLSVQCYFYNPYSGGGARKVLDAAELSEGNLAVSTDKGLYFYSPTARSWYASPAGRFSSGGGSLHLLGSHLVQVIERPGDFELITLKLADLQIPTSCSSSPVNFNEKARRVQAVALYPQDQRMAFINEEGALIQWYGGAEIETLPPPGKEPLSSGLKRIFSYSPNAQQPDPDFLRFTTTNGILQYDLQKHSWSEIPLKLSLDGDTVKDIDICAQGLGETVILQTGRGRFFLGTIPPSPGTAVDQTVEMKPVFSPHSGFNQPGSRLLDVQLRNQYRWTFVLDDRIKYYDPVKREWSADIVIPAASANSLRRPGGSFEKPPPGPPQNVLLGQDFLVYLRVKERGVVVVNGGQGQVWWVGRQADDHPVSFSRYVHQPGPGETTALDNSGTIWRLLPDARLYRLTQPLQGDYRIPAAPEETPFRLDPQQVKGAFEWPGRILFDTTTGLRLLDKTRREEIPLPENLKHITGIKEIVKAGEQLWIRTPSGQRTRFGDIPENIAFPDRINNQWSQLAANVIPLPDGQSAYDPITQLVVDGSGRLMALRPGGETFLAQAGAINPGRGQLPDPLDVGWLRWDRKKKAFAVKTPTGVKILGPEEFIREGQLMFEEIDALLAVSSSRLCAANRHGIWNYTQQDLSLKDPALTFQPVQWRQPLGAAHGRFITPDGVYNPEGQPLEPTRAQHRVTLGDVTFSESIRETGIQGRVNYRTGSSDAFDTRGFTWDHHKRGLAYTSNDLLVHSDAGLHPVKGYTGFELPPDQGRLSSPQPGEIFFKSGTTWYRRQGPANWKKGIPDPFGNRVLVDNPTWKWELKKGEPEVRLKGNAYGFKIISTVAGIAFTADLLQDATAVDNRLMAMSEAFLESATPSSQLSHFQAHRSPPLPCRRLEITRDIDKGTNLVLYSGSRYYLWNNASQQFAPSKSSDPPGGDRLLAKIPLDYPRLRFTREHSGRIKKELRVENLSGNSSWVPFGFRDSHFPFDVVTSIAASATELYVGTGAGLQVYTGKLDTGLANIASLYPMAGGSREPFAAVQQVGIPLDRPEAIMAYSAGECLEKPANSKTFRLCSNPGELNQRLRHQTAFWQFIHSSGRLEGRYKNEKNRFASEPIVINQGRWPHDRINDFAVFNGQVFTLWANGWVSRHGNLSLELNRDLVNYDTRGLEPRRFILGGSELYIEGKAGRVWHYTQAPAPAPPWQEIVEPGKVRGLLEYVPGAPIVNRQRLRLLPPGGRAASLAGGKTAFTFEYRGADGQWQPLPWSGDSMAIDRWSEFLFLDNKLWAATPLGLVSFSLARQPGQNQVQAVLDPDSFQVIAQPQRDGKIPEITDMEVRANIVTLRCRSSSEMVFQGPLEDTPGSQGFTHLADSNSDPFAREMQVVEKDNGTWEWVREGSRDFHPGRLKATFHGENLQLVGGKFPFDSINSLVFSREDRVEIGTESGGWYRWSIPPGGSPGVLAVSQLQRPQVPGINPVLVKEVRGSRGQEGEPILGLRIPGAGFIRLGREGISGKTEQFPQYLGSDGFWRYRQEDGEERLSITAIKSRGNQGAAKRVMANGRFSDDIVLGLPVSGTDQEGNYWLVPTAAGVLRLDEERKLVDIYSKETLRLPNEAAPRVLYVDTRPGVKPALYLGPDGFHPLESPHEAIPGLKPYVPPGAEVLAVEAGPQDFVRFLWQKEKERGWTLLDPSEPGNAVSNIDVLYVNLKEFQRYNSSSQSWLRVHFNASRMEFLRYGAETPYQMEYPESLELLTALVQGRRLLFIGKTNLWEINLEQVYRRLPKNRGQKKLN